MPKIELPDVAKEEWVAWKHSPVTKRAIAGLMNKREYILEGLAERLFGTNDERLMAIGEAGALKDAVVYMIDDFDYIVEENKEDDQSDSVSDSN